MSDAKVYSAETIEELQQKVDAYKETLAALKGGNSIEEVLFMKAEFNNFKEKTTALETLIETMNENQTHQIDIYKKDISSLSAQIESLNSVVEALTKKITSTTSSEHQVDSHLTTQSSPIKNTHTMNRSAQKQQNAIPSYKQLQKMVTQAQSIEDLELGSKPQEINRNQHETQQSSIQTNPSRFSTEQLNRRPRSFGNFNEPTTQKRISYKFSNISAVPLPIHTPTHQLTSEKLTDTEEPKTIPEEPIHVSNDKGFTENTVETYSTEKLSMNDILTHKLDELLQSEALIQKIETIYHKEQSQRQEKPANTHHTLVQASTQENPKSEVVTEQKEELIEPLATPAQPEAEHKAASSLLNFFRKK